MPLALVVIALVGACKFHFDETGDAGFSDAPVIAIDAPPSHDEDGDDVVDSEDNCPHVAGALTDRDGDMVGDLCDPEPDIARQQLVFFDPFVNATNWTLVGGSWLQEPDALRCDAEIEYAEIQRPQAFQFGVIELGMDIVTRTATAAQHQVTFATLDTKTQPYHYVEAFEFNTSAGYAAFSEFDGTQYTPIASVPMMTGVHPGPFRLRLKIIPPVNYEILVGWPTEEYTPGGSLGNTAPLRSNLHVGAFGVIVEIRYAVVIATN